MNFENIEFWPLHLYECGDYKRGEVVPSRCHGGKISG